MNEPRRPINTPEENALFAFGDKPDAAPANDLEATVRRLQRATNLDVTPSSMPTDLKSQIWEDLMHAHPSTASLPISERQGVTPNTIVIPSCPRRLRGIFDPSHTGSTPRRPTWDRVFSVAITAVLVLATVAMVSRLAGNPFSGPGGESPPEPLRFAAFQDGSQSELFEVAPVPDPSECSVEPLTVDEVMERIQVPLGYAAPDATPGAGTPTAFEQEQEELAGVAFNNIPDLATVNEIETTHRQWLACHLAGDLFRAWALESGTMIQTTIFSVYGPVFDPEMLREDLEALVDGEEDTPFRAMTASPEAYVPLVVTSGWNTHYPEPHTGKVVIPFYWTTVDGSVAGIPAYLSESQYNDPAYATLRESTNLPNLATYILDFETRQWILDGFQRGQG